MLVLLGVLTVRSRFSDPDMWWHLKTGEVIWTTHSIPTTDLFSYTTNHHAWVPHEWLSQVLMYGLLRFMQHDADTKGVKRSPLAVPAGQPPPAPNLLTDEQTNLKTFRAEEEKKLSSYSWIDQSAGTVRIPIDRAKELLLERGLPVGAPAAPATTPAATAKSGK